MGSNQEYSRVVSRSLDYLGYSQQMIRHRVKITAEMIDYYNRTFMHPIKMHQIYSGSKGEGLTAPYESDIDIMHVDVKVICANSTEQFINYRNITVFQTDRREICPGYAQLRLVQLGNRVDSSIPESLFKSETGDMYVSSDFFVKAKTQTLLDFIYNEPLGRTFHAGELAGPSSTFISGTVSRDLVHSFVCICPDILHSFITRHRYYGWPTPELLRDVSFMEAHVVPVGSKGSDNSYKEWRICFTRAEIHLIHNFNDTQTKLYILLKMVAKDIIKPVCNCITSYIMKNVVFWMAEYNPQDHFTEELLVERLVKSLVFLKNCVEANFMPNFMIPERNLFAERLEVQHRLQLSVLLTELLCEGGYLLLRCEKLRMMLLKMYQFTEVAVDWAIKRDTVEKLSLRNKVILNSIHLQPGVSLDELMRLCCEDEESRNNEMTIINLILPDFIVLLQQGLDSGAIYKERLKAILS